MIEKCPSGVSTTPAPQDRITRVAIQEAQGTVFEGSPGHVFPLSATGTARGTGAVTWWDEAGTHLPPRQKVVPAVTKKGSLVH